VAGYQRLDLPGPGRPPSSPAAPERTSTQWCLTVSVITFLCAISLIGVSEGWLETMGLGHRVAHDKDCSSPKFTKQTLKLLAEEPVQRLASVKGAGGEDLLAKFEASGITSSRGKHNYYVVFDNSYFIAKFASELSFHHKQNATRTNKLLPWPGKLDNDTDSGFESISWNATSDTYLVMQEAVRFDDGLFGNVFEIDINPKTDAVTVLRSCRCDYSFSSDNKGFEGTAIVKHPNGKEYLLGLCEGNFCEGGKSGRKPGHGRIVVMEREINADEVCTYREVAVVPIPKDANFEDYSDMDIRGAHIAITSQVNGAIWVGKFKLLPEEKGVIELKPGRIWDFPRNDACQLKYCNVEGVVWEDADKVALVSDKMKSKGKQSHRCWEKDQMIHAFAVNSGSLVDVDAEEEL